MGLLTRTRTIGLILTIMMIHVVAVDESHRPDGLRAPYINDLFLGQFNDPGLPEFYKPTADSLDPYYRDGHLQLNLDRILEMAVRNNLGIQLQRYSVLESEQGFFQSHAMFEPLWNQSFSVSRDTNASPSIFQGVGSTVNKEVLYTTGISKFFSTGTTLQGNLTLRRYENNNIFFLVNPGYESSWTLSLTQNLLKGFGRDVNRAPIMIAENSLHITEQEFRLQLENTILQAAKLYWDILYLEKDLEVKQESLHLAERTRDDVQVQVEVGTQPELNLYRAKAAVALRQQELIDARSALKDARQQLLNFIMPKANLERDPDAALDLVSADLNQQPAIQPWPEAIKLVLEERPEIRMAEAGMAISDIQLRVARNRLKPDLSITGSYSQYGLKGTIANLDSFPFEIPPGTPELLNDAFAGGAWGSLRNSLDGKYNGFKVQVNLSIPIGNLDARTQARRAALELEKQKSSLEQLRQQLASQLRTIYNQLDRDRASIVAARQGVEEAMKTLEGEQAKYDAGIVVIRDLLEAQRNLAQAQTLENLARIQLQKTGLDYYMAISRLLDHFNIQTIAAMKGDTHEAN